MTVTIEGTRGTKIALPEPEPVVRYFRLSDLYARYGGMDRQVFWRMRSRKRNPFPVPTLQVSEKNPLWREDVVLEWERVEAEYAAEREATRELARQS